MKKASMTYLVAAAFALPVAAWAQSNDGNNNISTDSGMKADMNKGGTASSGAAPNRSASTTLSDAAITAKVKTQFIKDKDVSALNVNVDTSNGVVTLKGNAKSRAESDKAASLARSVEGVKSVKNDLVIGAATANRSSGASTGAANSSGSVSGATPRKDDPSSLKPNLDKDDGKSN